MFNFGKLNGPAFNHRSNKTVVNAATNPSAELDPYFHFLIWEAVLALPAYGQDDAVSNRVSLSRVGVSTFSFLLHTCLFSSPLSFLSSIVIVIVILLSAY
jgi:hypothetical protein